MSTLLYNPDRKSKEQLLSEFVVRTQVYEEIMHDLETSKMKYPEQHYLLVGQRGAGKTTLLNRIKYGIEDSKKLKDKLIPIIFSEEQYNISELANLWENVSEFLEDYYGFEGLYNEIEKNIEKKNFEELSFDILEKHLNKHNKKLVLLIDNIGDLLKKLDKPEVHRLREILQTKKEIRLIAGSPFYLETILDYHQPLFEFFKVVRLDGLSQIETQDLLLKLAELNNETERIQKIVKETPERIETLRTLTGGVPRTIALMYRIFTDYNDESTVKDLERILDAVTPLYKHRMDDLPVQQQKIVDAVAKKWDAISVKELNEKVRIDSKNISAQLRQLEKNQVIEKKGTGTKNHLYFLKERFFNIWYLMRYGRKDDRQRVVWLVKFLESWCSSIDLRKRILDYVEKIKTKQLDQSAMELFGNVYTSFSNLDFDVKLLLKKSTPSNISQRIIISKKELSLEIKKNEDTKNWIQILEIANNVEEFSAGLKRAIFNAVFSLSNENSKNEYFQSLDAKIDALSDETKGESENSVILELTPLELEILKHNIWRGLNRNLFQSKTDDIFTGFEIYCKLSAPFISENSFEKIMLQELFCLLLAQKYYNLVNKIFNDIKEFDFANIFRPVYFAYVYLKDGKNSIEYLKAGPELQETISEILKRVDTYFEMVKNLKRSKIDPTKK